MEIARAPYTNKQKGQQVASLNSHRLHIPWEHGTFDLMGSYVLCVVCAILVTQQSGQQLKGSEKAPDPTTLTESIRSLVHLDELSRLLLDESALNPRYSSTNVSVRKGPFDGHAEAHETSKRMRMALCGIMLVKYEAHTLLHWVTYHLMFGVDHIFLYIDDTKDPPMTKAEIRIVDALAQLTGQVTVTYILDLHLKKGGQAKIFPVCQAAAKAGNFDWVGHWDGDEYLTAGRAPTGSREEARRKGRKQLSALPFDVGEWLASVPRLYAYPRAGDAAPPPNVESVTLIRTNLVNGYTRRGAFHGVRTRRSSMYFEGALSPDYILRKRSGGQNVLGKPIIRANTPANGELKVHYTKFVNSIIESEYPVRAVVASWPWHAAGIEEVAKKHYPRAMHLHDKRTPNPPDFYYRVKSDLASQNITEHSQEILNGECSLPTVSGTKKKRKKKSRRKQTKQKQQQNVDACMTQDKALFEAHLENMDVYFESLRNYHGPRLVHFLTRSIEECEEKKKDNTKGISVLDLSRSHQLADNYTHRTFECNPLHHKVPGCSDAFEFSTAKVASLVNRETARWLGALLVR